jgi:hypothetical protein
LLGAEGRTMAHCTSSRGRLTLRLTRFHGSSAILMIERIQAIGLLWDGAENAVKR